MTAPPAKKQKTEQSDEGTNNDHWAAITGIL